MEAMDVLTKGSSGSVLAEKTSKIIKGAIRKGQAAIAQRYIEEDLLPLIPWPSPHFMAEPKFFPCVWTKVAILRRKILLVLE